MATEHGKQRKQRIKSHIATTGATQVISEPKQGFPCRKKLFGFLSLGCGRVSSPAMAVHLPEKSRRRRKKKKQRKSRESCPENVCCTPPSIGFAYDVALSTSVDAHRRNHRQCARSARHVMNVQQRPWSTTHVNEATFIRSNVPDSRQFNRLQRRSPEGIPEIVMFEQNPLLNGRLEGSDRFGAWRINADLMSYEELVELSDRIGYVDGGLQEEEILECLKRPKKSIFKSFDFSSKAKDYKCSICQEECKGDEDLGRLECGHFHHLDCIKQWLLRKNECPICKAAAKSDK